MKKTILFLISLSFLFSCSKNAEHTQGNKINIGTIDSLFSKNLNEQRKIWVYVPTDPTKSSKTKYPVLYLLDGDSHFASVVGLMQQLGGNSICPDMIVVGIPNTDRTRDLTPTRVKKVFGDTTFSKTSGGGENFTKFISDELVPYIERQYPATTYRTMIGHSLGGLMAVNTIVHHPDIFANYLAIDPSMWWDARKLSHEATTVLDDKKFANKFLYVAIANTMREGMQLSDLAKDTTSDTEHIRSIMEFSDMAKAKTSGLRFESKYYPDDNHGSVPLIAEYDALRAMFSWYRMKGFNQYFDSKSKASAQDVMKAVQDHYAMLSDHFGYTMLPSENLVNQAGYGFMNNKMPDKAFAFFDLNIKNYPESPNVYDSMGDYYLNQKDTVKAIASFEKTLSLADVSYTKEKLGKLKKN